VSFVGRIRLWWNRDKLQLVEEDAQLPEHERQVDEQDFEGKMDDVRVQEYYSPRGTDFERDSEPPRHP
jgi:hypothetical protein